MSSQVQCYVGTKPDNVYYGTLVWRPWVLSDCIRFTVGQIWCSEPHLLVQNTVREEINKDQLYPDPLILGLAGPPETRGLLAFPFLWYSTMLITQSLS